MPSFKTLASGRASFTYSYTPPEQMMPSFLLPSSMRLTANPFASSERRCMRSSTTVCRTRALAGIMTYFAIFLSYGRRGTFSRSPSSTRLCECATRVVRRRMTGVSYVSESEKASFANSFASALSEGSSTGTCALTAVRRVSCSFCEEKTDGSSATAMTSPRSRPYRRR